MVRRVDLVWKATAMAAGAAAGGAHTACAAGRVAGREGRRAARQPRRAPHLVAGGAELGGGIRRGLAVTRLVAQRGAAAAWKAKTGSNPPGLEDVA